MTHFEQPFIDLLKRILAEGETRTDRTGVGTVGVFGGPELRFDLREAFPLITIKKTLWRSAFIEMLWFIRGESNINFLKEHDVPIWNAWAKPDGSIGPVYGVQWRHWPGETKTYTSDQVHDYWVQRDRDSSEYAEMTDAIKNGKLISVESAGAIKHYKYSTEIDQLATLINDLKKNPFSRRHIVSAWNPTYLKTMGLPPCHFVFQCNVSNDRALDLKLNMRSWDTCLGGPFNIAQYAMLTHLLARAANLTPRYLMISYGDAHIYSNHITKIKEMLETRKPVECKPKLVINTNNIDIDGYKIDDFNVEGYESNEFIKLPIAV